MNKYSPDQLDWIKRLSELDPAGIASRATARGVLWYNPTNIRSMRLTKPGLVYLSKQLKLTSYDFDLPKTIVARVLLRLERHIHYPYYIDSTQSIVVFDELTACMLTLHNSNLEKYLDDLDRYSS